MSDPTVPETRIVKPREAKVFVYKGEQVPNQVSITNLSREQQANFIMQALDKFGYPEWSVHGTLAAAETAFVLVHWPSTRALFTNGGEYNTDIQIGGDGIFANRDADPSTVIT